MIDTADELIRFFHFTDQPPLPTLTSGDKGTATKPAARESAGLHVLRFAASKKRCPVSTQTDDAHGHRAAGVRFPIETEEQ